MILPNKLNALVALSGAAQSLALGRPSLMDALIAGALAGALLLAVAKAYEHARGVEGLGLGDVKLAAAGAVWTGVGGIGPMLLAATASCAAALLCRAALRGGFDPHERFAFGPFLAMGVFAAWLLAQWA